MKKSLSFFVVFTLLTLNVSKSFSKTYKIGCVNDYYPYVSLNSSGELEGIIIDWWKLWSEKTGVEIEFVQLDIQGCIDKTISGELDAISSMFYNEERAEYLNFSEPILRMKTVLFLKKGIKPESLKDLEVAITLVENSKSHYYMETNFPELKLNLLKSHSTLLNNVLLEDIDAFTYSIPNPVGNFKQSPPPDGYYEYQTLFVDRLRPVVKKGNTEMLNLLTSGASKISYEELLQIAYDWELFKKDRTLLWIGFGIGFAFLVIIAVVVLLILKNRRKSKKITDFESRTDWQVIIDKGENDYIEFKSSLRWDYRQEKVNKALEQVIVKTISAFLNTQGGMLFIGIDDEGNAVGLENDYQGFSKKNRDGFLLALTNLINQNLGKSCHKFLTINIVSLNEKDVCIVNIEKSNKPVFLGKGDKEEFYIRASASSQPMGLKEAHNYINSHWKK